MALQTFTAGQVLTAAQVTALQTNDFNQTVSTKTASHVLVAADKGTRVEMNAAGATTITVNTSLFNAGDTLFIQNIGAGVCTITAGTATVSTSGDLALVENAGGTLFFVSAGVAIFYASGVPSGLTLISTTTIGTAVASVTVSGAFSATFENYKIVVTNTDGSLNDEGILVKFNNVSGSTYHRTFAFIVNATGAITGVGVANVNTGITVALCNTSNGSFMFDVYTPFTTTTTSVTGFASQGSTVGLIGCSGQDRHVASQTGFDLIIAGGATLTGGTIYVYGYQK